MAGQPLNCSPARQSHGPDTSPSRLRMSTWESRRPVAATSRCPWGRAPPGAPILTAQLVGKPSHCDKASGLRENQRHEGHIAAEKPTGAPRRQSRIPALRRGEGCWPWPADNREAEARAGDAEWEVAYSSSSSGISDFAPHPTLRQGPSLRLCQPPSAPQNWRVPDGQWRQWCLGTRESSLEVRTGWSLCWVTKAGHRCQNRGYEM